MKPTDEDMEADEKIVTVFKKLKKNPSSLNDDLSGLSTSLLKIHVFLHEFVCSF